MDVAGTRWYLVALNGGVEWDLFRGFRQRRLYGGQTWRRMASERSGYIPRCYTDQEFPGRSVCRRRWRYLLLSQPGKRVVLGAYRKNLLCIWRNRWEGRHFVH